MLQPNVNAPLILPVRRLRRRLIIATLSPDGKIRPRGNVSLRLLMGQLRTDGNERGSWHLGRR